MKKNLLKTYLSMIQNSSGTNMFRNLYVIDDHGQEIDVIRDGEVACSYFASSIMHLFNLIDSSHATVETTIKKMIEAGWQVREVSQIQNGDVIIWENIQYVDGSWHPHIGFYIGDAQAISMSAQSGFPIVHHYTYENKREITQVLFFPYWGNHSLLIPIIRKNTED